MNSYQKYAVLVASLRRRQNYVIREIFVDGTVRYVEYV